MVTSQQSSGTKSQIQFPCPNVLRDKLNEDTKKSQFSSRPKYLNALLEQVLTLESCADSAPDSACIEELFSLIELFQSLPVERIQRLAPTQNRTFAQMLRHLVEVALSYYPEEVPRDRRKPKRAVRSTDVDINRQTMTQGRERRCTPSRSRKLR